MLDQRMRGAGRPGNRMWLVFRKEVREVFRDKRTTFSVIISPLIITPALLGLMGSLINSQVSQAKTETYKIGVVGGTQSPTLNKIVASTPNVETEALTTVQAQNEIRDRRIRAAVVLPANSEELLKAAKAVPIRLLIDPGNDKSISASQRLREAFDESGKLILKARLSERNLSPDLATPVKITEEAVPGGGSSATFALAMFLPYVLAISAIAGGLYAANDMVAGEKERGTLETLLVSPASRRELVLGKFMAVATVCLVSSFLSVVGLMIPFVLPLKAFEWLAKGGFHIKASAGIAILLVQLPLAILFAGLLLAISTFARNQKEAQTYISPLLLVVMVPAMMSMMMKAEAPLYMALVPVLNATLVLKQALSNIFDPAFIGVAFVSSGIYAALALLFATRLFQNEGVLLKA